MSKQTDDKKSHANAVFALSRPSRCYGCDAKLLADEIVKLNEKDNDETEVFCRKCAGLADLEILRSGNAQVTRLAKKYSKRHFVIMKWSEIWKAYERQGLLVEPDALKQAKQEANKNS